MLRQYQLKKYDTKVTDRAILPKRKEFTDYFTPLQHVVSVEGSAELLLQQVQPLMEKHED